MTTDAPVLEIEHLSIALPHGLDRRFAVHDLSLAVRKRQIVCVVGESGSGKSVTAAAVMRLLPERTLRIASGHIRLEGEDIAQASPERICALRGNRMAMIFQEPLTALNPVMRIGDQIGEVIRIHRPGTPAADVEKRVLALLSDVHLPDPALLRRSFPHQLSGGQRQRVMIAMALALEPALIIADEPTTALDVTTQAQILRLMRELLIKHESGVLMITHDFDVVSAIADYVVVMRHGEVVEQGLPSQILEKPRHPYTRALISAVPRLNCRPSPEKTAEPLLSVSDLSLTYRTSNLFRPARVTRALDRVSFDLAAGETLGVVGESGSGKTSLSKAILRFEPVDEGTILFRGNDVLSLTGAKLRQFRRNIQMVFQDPYKSLNPRRRILQSITEGPVQHGVPTSRATERAGELMELVGLPKEALDRFPHEFSGGQRQRICIARALAMEPSVIVADEAVSALDVSVQAQVLELLNQLQKQLGFSMIFVTHDLRVASNICNRIAVMRQGRIVEIGPTGEVFGSPQQPYTRELLAAAVLRPGAI
ncbi:ABC transporter ATP-binding protein [Azorhizobium caulinodans ORS 571]|uniref:ABC transporter ATP-binding protein n=1 Tax=Azorhizobium caulinodans (strain ATCC 43989 / DSM 5975 / JCM 20966 / LMG 6465 / NBRC 14845 / NCIMB 13405 / ORS 571) TaxID=438753 RepID=A8I2G0_AZOC5|nr:ABC transporter ATP-binding protein [Azorhizobium caulinodans]BAF87866.1 ABC transporter ATP-binding protein [Azorhizobium caulinodans ORS 571]